MLEYLAIAERILPYMLQALQLTARRRQEREHVEQLALHARRAREEAADQGQERFRQQHLRQAGLTLEDAERFIERCRQLFQEGNCLDAIIAARLAIIKAIQGQVTPSIRISDVGRLHLSIYYIAEIVALIGMGYYETAISRLAHVESIANELCKLQVSDLYVTCYLLSNNKIEARRYADVCRQISPLSDFYKLRSIFSHDLVDNYCRTFEHIYLNKVRVGAEEPVSFIILKKALVLELSKYYIIMLQKFFLANIENMEPLKNIILMAGTCLQDESLSPIDKSFFYLAQAKAVLQLYFLNAGVEALAVQKHALMQLESESVEHFTARLHATVTNYTPLELRGKAIELCDLVCGPALDPQNPEARRLSDLLHDVAGVEISDLVVATRYKSGVAEYGVRLDLSNYYFHRVLGEAINDADRIPARISCAQGGHEESIFYILKNHPELIVEVDAWQKCREIMDSEASPLRHEAALLLITAGRDSAVYQELHHDVQVACMRLAARFYTQAKTLYVRQLLAPLLVPLRIAEAGAVAEGLPLVFSNVPPENAPREVLEVPREDIPLRIDQIRDALASLEEFLEVPADEFNREISIAKFTKLPCLSMVPQSVLVTREQRVRGYRLLARLYANMFRFTNSPEFASRERGALLNAKRLGDFEASVALAKHYRDGRFGHAQDKSLAASSFYRVATNRLCRDDILRAYAALCWVKIRYDEVSVFRAVASGSDYVREMHAFLNIAKNRGNAAIKKEATSYAWCLIVKTSFVAPLAVLPSLKPF